jgi:NADH:ubiquinone oxidoreductase subunit F (NADH-binding)/NADH:ubiquinone oxidoreductase subunit E
MLVEALFRIQNQSGWLPNAELQALAEQLRVPLYRLEEVSSFFPHFRRQPPPEFEVKVCRDMSCHVHGAGRVLAQLQNFKRDRGLNDKQLIVEGCSCLGRCDRAPIMSVEDQRHSDNQKGSHHGLLLYAAQTPESACAVLENLLAGKPTSPHADSTFPRNSATPWEIDVYAGAAPEQRYETVRWYLGQSSKSPPAGSATEQQLADEVLRALETGGLLGMGGAGGRTYKKWQEVRGAQATPKYVVCNGDESEPGTFKDREILLRAPHLVVEGVILGGLVVGAERGIIYIRHEFEEQIDSIRKAIAEAEQLGICGANILGTGRSFGVEVFVSPGGYICGEQTALIEAISDRRAEPRNRPPELQTNGLWDKPTLLNNVETLAWVPAIVLKEAGKWFAEQGVSGCKGRRFFSISGHVNRPGAYEVPIGITLKELICDYAGGVTSGLPIKALALSGPSGGLLPQKMLVEHLGRKFAEKNQLKPGETFDLLDMRLDIAIARDMGIMMGAGMVVYADGVDIVEEALTCLTFFRNESCGKCVPCRIGSQKLVEMATDLKAGRIDTSLLSPLQTTVEQLAETMKLTAICGLGTVAPNPMTTLLRHFRDDVEQQFRDGPN